eukprot:CAMPEP_0174250852 /NCGR_PEP_ID=MMETSP0439-20130205/884_1 /TAXON_ID=0 /ORGANISM="Stereomyxa ramosa, Strain Chinc5" /LENGTH=229 /DNA_ID=CAMNT_0015331021 /DNA_START=12 /DNA_END=697 /DNA_ORIENTATION=+
MKAGGRYVASVVPYFKNQFSYVLFFIAVVKAVVWADLCVQLERDTNADVFVDFALREKETFTTSLPEAQEQGNEKLEEGKETEVQLPDPSLTYWVGRTASPLEFNHVPKAQQGLMSGQLFIFLGALALINLFPAYMGQTRSSKTLGPKTTPTTKLLIGLLLVCVVVGGVEGAGLPPREREGGPGYALEAPPLGVGAGCGLRCWLSHLNISFPDQHLSLGGFNVTLRNMG